MIVRIKFNGHVKAKGFLGFLRRVPVVWTVDAEVPSENPQAKVNLVLAELEGSLSVTKLQQ